MRRSIFFMLPMLLVLGGCATAGSSQAMVEIPSDAVATTKQQPNGDEITEYRVAGQLRVVKVQPERGPAYYLQDRNGDGRPDDDNISPVYFKLFGW
jgi:outer membrane biogenesis lipoprotein LolB